MARFQFGSRRNDQTLFIQPQVTGLVKTDAMFFLVGFGFGGIILELHLSVKYTFMDLSLSVVA